ncbi:unnamed protein product, partial [Amoebophrya sp. A120]
EGCPPKANCEPSGKEVDCTPAKTLQEISNWYKNILAEQGEEAEPVARERMEALKRGTYEMLHRFSVGSGGRRLSTFPVNRLFAQGISN